jgi:hypothetical protein
MPPINIEKAFKGLSAANQPQKLIEEAKEKCQIVLDPNAKEFLPRKAAVCIESQFVEDAGAAEFSFVLPYQQQRAKLFQRGSFMTGPPNLRKFQRIQPKSKAKSKLDTNSIDYTWPFFVLPYQKQSAKPINRGSSMTGPQKLCTFQSQFCSEEYLTPTKAVENGQVVSQTDQPHQNAEEAYNPYDQTYFSVNQNSLESTKHFKKIRFFSTNATYLGKLSRQYFSPELVIGSQTLPAVKLVQPRVKAGPKAPRAREGQGSRQRRKSGRKTKPALNLLDTSGLETYIPKHHRPWTLMQVWPKDKLGLKVLGHVGP